MTAAQVFSHLDIELIKSGQRQRGWKWFYPRFVLAQYQGQPEKGPAARETSEKVNLNIFKLLRPLKSFQLWSGGGGGHLWESVQETMRWHLFSGEEEDGWAGQVVVAGLRSYCLQYSNSKCYHKFNWPLVWVGPWSMRDRWKLQRWQLCRWVGLLNKWCYTQQCWQHSLNDLGGHDEIVGQFGTKS